MKNKRSNQKWNSTLSNLDIDNDFSQLTEDNIWELNSDWEYDRSRDSLEIDRKKYEIEIDWSQYDEIQIQVVIRVR